MLFLQILIGLFLSYTVLLMITRQQTTSVTLISTSRSIKSAVIDSTVQNLLNQTAANIPRRRREAPDTSGIMSSSSTSTSDLLEPSSSTLQDSSISTSTKYHKPKPEVADGDQLEQSHKTKVELTDKNRAIWNRSIILLRYLKYIFWNNIDCFYSEKAYVNVFESLGMKIVNL